MHRRILFTSQKGGVGKSTLARSAAVALAYAGRKVLLADFDVDQRTCMRWQAQRVARALEPKIDVEAFSKEKKLGRVEFDYEDVVIDTRGQLDELSWISQPRQTSSSFLRAFHLTMYRRRYASSNRCAMPGVPSARIAIVFCRTGGSKKQGQLARSILEMNRIAVLNAVLPQKDGFISLYATGRTGREAPQPKLRSVALAVDEALLAFIEGASAPVPKLVANGGNF